MDREQRRILIVEDEKKWQDVLETMLRNEGHLVEVAASYGEALGELWRKPFGLVVIDLRLSPMDEANRDGAALLEDASNKGIPAIVITGYGSLDLAREAVKEYNVLSFLDKASFDSERFKELVKETMEAGLKSRPGPLQEKRMALLQTVEDLYRRAQWVLDEREKQYFDWLEAIGKERITTEVEASRKRRERDLKEIDEWYKQSRERIDQAKDPQELDTIRLELIREGENWVASFSEFERP